MTDKEILTYRALMGVIALTSVVAAMATYLASCNDAAWEGLTALVDSVPLIPARYWSQGSDFPDLAAIYFFLRLAGISGVSGCVRRSPMDSQRDVLGLARPQLRTQGRVQSLYACVESQCALVNGRGGRAWRVDRQPPG